MEANWECCLEEARTRISTATDFSNQEAALQWWTEAGDSRGTMVASWEARKDEDLRNLNTGSEVTGEDIRVNNNLKLK